MKLYSRLALVFSLLLAMGSWAHAADQAGAAAAPAGPPMVLPDRILGDPKAPVKVDEYISLTCSHCAEFYTETLPILEKRYVDTGKVRFIVHDFVMDRTGLEGAVLARCLPADHFYPFIKTLYANQKDWVLTQDPDKVILSYAKLGGLSSDKADACLKNTKLQDAVVAERNAVENKVEATPTFILNDGADTIAGAQSVETFSAAFEKLLAAKQ